VSRRTLWCFGIRAPIPLSFPQNPQSYRLRVNPIPSSTAGTSDSERRSGVAGLTLIALGVVYGDIGTSPLYAVRECFHGESRVPLTPENVLGVLSLIVWSLVLVVSLKYLTFVMRADNDGEGGILALMTLAVSRRGTGRKAWVLTVLGLFGAGLLYGDGAITPAISVLSAVEGMHVATSAFDEFVVPIAAVILLLLFLGQSHGTAKVGRLFGPVMLVWFAVIAVLGIAEIIQQPGVLAAVSPHHALWFFAANQWEGFVVLGVVFLVVTGAEALYADMGHFGAPPIRLAWFAVVLPALLANYFGQGALLLSRPDAVKNPFYHLAPDWALYPLVVLATAATVIASQAVISGAFSLTSQSISLGFGPRMAIVHTSKEERGQIYVPAVNWLLFAAVIGLVLSFGSSSRLANAYGMAVTTAMVITAALFFVVARNRWKWPLWIVAALTGLFLAIDLAFFGANLIKIHSGGWFPLLIGTAICVVLTTWIAGRRATAAALGDARQSVEELLHDVAENPPHRIPSPAIYLTASEVGVPVALVHNLRHNRVLHEPVGLLTVVIEERPWVPLDERLELTPLGEGLYRVFSHYGYKQPPNVPNVVELCAEREPAFAAEEATYFLGRMTLEITDLPGMARWRKRLFHWLLVNAGDVSAYFGLPPEQVVEIGLRVEI
jgi:KUP system potassium uptake protein